MQEANPNAVVRTAAADPAQGKEAAWVAYLLHAFGYVTAMMWPAIIGVVVNYYKRGDPPGDLANAAVYVFEPEVIEAAAELGRPVVDLSTEVIPRFLGSILAVETHGYHRDIGTPEALSLAEAEWRPPAERGYAA